MNEIETYSIHIVIFHINSSPRDDEVIALRLGQSKIDHQKYNHVEDKKYRVDISGPTIVTTQDLPIKFVHKVDIVYLKTGQRIVFDFIVKKGRGADHVKWRPVASFSVKEVNKGFEITFRNVGMLTDDEIIEEGMKKMKEAIDRPAPNIFSRLVVPKELINKEGTEFDEELERLLG